MDKDLPPAIRYVIRKEAIAWQNVAPEALLVHAEEIHLVNPTAATIIEALHTGATLAELVERVTNDYEVEAAQAAADIEAFLKVGLDAGFVAEERDPS